MNALTFDAAFSLLCDEQTLRARMPPRLHSPRIAPAPPPPAHSPDGTQLTLWSGGSLTDRQGNVWRLDGPGTSVGPGITLAGVYCGQAAELLTIKAGVVWGRHPAGDWFTLVAPGVATPQPAGP